MHDLVIRDGTVVDGTDREAFRADVAVDGDRIVEVGRVSGAGAPTLDAAGRGRTLDPGRARLLSHRRERPGRGGGRTSHREAGRTGVARTGEEHDPAMKGSTPGLATGFSGRVGSGREEKR